MQVYWLEQKEADVPPPSERQSWLGASELAHLHGLRFPKRRADWLLGRWTAKRAVARCLNLPSNLSALADLEICAASDGAPEAFLAGKAAPVTISLSHRAGLAVCAVAAAATLLGCDLELVEPRIATFAADYFAPEEQDLVAQAQPSERPRLLTLIWSAKESALKALRAGLRLDTRSVIVAPGDGSGPWHPLHVRHDSGREFGGWWQTSGVMVRTLVAQPRANPPTFLSDTQA
jgi:4'-phosphopantetheinyl transferase